MPLMSWGCKTNLSSETLCLEKNFSKLFVFNVCKYIPLNIAYNAIIHSLITHFISSFGLKS